MLRSSILWDITRVKNVKPFKMGAIACPEILVNIYQQRAPSRRGGSLKSRKEKRCYTCLLSIVPGLQKSFCTLFIPTQMRSVQNSNTMITEKHSEQHKVRSFLIA